ncbi:MAG: response regulator transcription factor [Gammaproteobacteria bacterium]|nr:response regulator transcription factor [Gammaproteobacteria bacterium]MDH5735109.1 response regulator transcription factor [Gammaproteobacteria bacterium]
MKSNKQIITGLILEDNNDARQYLYDVLESSFPGVMIEMVSSIEEASHFLDRAQPDIALIDLNLPDGSGVEILNRLSHEGFDCISVVTTIYDDDSHLFSALRAGAQGYLLKEQRRELLIEALQGITEGKPALTPKIALKILDHFSNSEEPEADIVQKPAEDDLSKREIQVLRMIAKGHSVKLVAKELNISHHTVASHIKNVYSKLGISNRAEATQKAVQLGFVD